MAPHTIMGSESARRTCKDGEYACSCHGPVVTKEPYVSTFSVFWQHLSLTRGKIEFLNRVL